VKDQKIQTINDKAHATSFGRHRAQCGVCRHPNREEIEREWVSWANPTLLAERFKLSRDALYRHAKAADLVRKRQENRKGSLERMLERADLASISGSTIMFAFKAYESLCERVEGKHTSGLPPTALFGRMTKEEREAFVQHGALPSWFSSEMDVTPSDNPGDELDGTSEGSPEGQQDATLTHSQEGQEELQVIETNDLQ
jgi:hypothetical protein